MKSLLELKCNVNPLDGLASEARKTMKSLPELKCNVNPLDGLASEARKTMKLLPELKCNVHPLDGLASEARKTMKSLPELKCNVHPLDGLASEARKTMKSLPELKCNVHPLDGLASEARKTMKSLEATFDVKGNVSGREAAAVNLTYRLSKMRYKNGKGDSKGFKQFMKMQNIKSKMIVLYVGNRMHVLFHLALSVLLSEPSFRSIFRNTATTTPHSRRHR